MPCLVPESEEPKQKMVSGGRFSVWTGQFSEELDLGLGCFLHFFASCSWVMQVMPCREGDSKTSTAVAMS